MALYMVCLNLPPEECCKSENMFLAGIIPGPNEPSKEEINQFFMPLVDNLLESYTNGVFYSHTWKYPSGRKTRSVIALFICDLPAAHQALGFTGHQSTNFCSYCKLQLNDIDNLNVGRWVSHTCKEHREVALKWHNAESEAQHDIITKKHGVHYSEFLSLPYVNPIQSLCVDSMHAFFLRILLYHCQEIWGMDIGTNDGDGTSSDPVSPEIKLSPDFQRAFLMLCTGTLQALQKFKKWTLTNLAKDQGLWVKA